MYDRSLRQTLMVWRKESTQDGFGGYDYTYAGLIACRYEAHQKMVVNAKGKEILSYARIFVKEDVAVDDFVLLNTDGEDSTAKANGEAFKVIHFIKNTGIKNRSIERILYLGGNV